jgi:hypothetical protein
VRTAVDQELRLTLFRPAPTGFLAGKRDSYTRKCARGARKPLRCSGRVASLTIENSNRVYGWLGAMDALRQGVGIAS